MKEILFNLALIDTLQFCKEHMIDCSGSHLVKVPRKYHYTLIKDETNTPLVTLAFRKNGPPLHYFY